MGTSTRTKPPPLATPWPSTSSPTGLQKSSPRTSPTMAPRRPSRMSSSSTRPTCPPASTGPQRAQSHQSRTKNNVAHAGPTPPPDPPRAPSPSQLVSEPTRWSPSPSKSSSTAPDHMATRAAMEVSWTMASSTSRPRATNLRLTTHTPQRPAHALPPSRALPPASRLARLASSTTPQESSPAPVAPALTTAFSLSDTAPMAPVITGRSRTHGAPPGVMLDTSAWQRAAQPLARPRAVSSLEARLAQLASVAFFPSHPTRSFKHLLLRLYIKEYCHKKKKKKKKKKVPALIPLL